MFPTSAFIREKVYIYYQTQKVVRKMVESNKMIATVVGIVVSLIIVATLLPTGIEALTNSTGDWGSDTIETLVVTLLPLIVVIGIVMLFLQRKKNA
jgi:choline-glycine betaine transporter